MLNFFIKHKKVRGVITVFMTMIYLSVYMLIGIFVDGGRIRMAQTVVEDVQQIATENVMSQYNRGLYEYYGLFGVSDYETKQIADDVKAQIEESIGLKIKDDTVKSFIEDLWVGTGTLYDELNSGKLTDDAIENGRQIVNDINQKVSDSHKKFDPYGINVISSAASCIDLTNVEVLRAQMRDEMRYMAPVVLGANFFDAVNQFMSLGDSANTVKNVADIITKTTDKIDEKEKAYETSLNSFSTQFQSFVKEAYEPSSLLVKWGQISRNADVVAKEKGFIEGIKAVFTGLFDYFKGKNDSAASEDTIVLESYAIATDMHLNENGGQGGFLDILTHYKNLSRFYDKFDNGPWPDGNDEPYTRDVLVGYDDDGNPKYEKRYFHDEHNDAVDSYAESYKRDYENSIDTFINPGNGVLTLAKSALDDTITKIQECMDAIGSAESYFKEGCETCTTKKSKAYYSQYMETYLRKWNYLDTQKKVLQRMKEYLNQLSEILDRSLIDVSTICSSIQSEHVSQSWYMPSHKLKSLRENPKDEFHKIMIGLAEDKNGINCMQAIQDNADAEAFSKDIFTLINSVLTNKVNEEKGITDKDDKELFGKISQHEKSDNILPTIYDECKTEFEKDTIVDRIGEIMTKAQDLVSALPKNLFDNIYDETYILSHCRDYVHTYRYDELYKSGKINDNSEDIDTVLNPKFIKDQSVTKYLSSEQFRELQVTPAEIEYILWGKENSIENVTIMYANIFIIRLALNYIAVCTSPNSSRQVNELAIAAGPFAIQVRFAAPLIYALPQSIKETKQIMYDCEKVKVWNGGRDLQLYSYFIDTVEETYDKLKASAEDIKDKAVEALNNAKENADTLLVIATVKTKSPPANIFSAAEYLETMIAEGILQPFLKSSDGKNNDVIKDEYDDDSIKAGYSDYLLIYLFINGIGEKNKNTQIGRLQDIIETNMSQSDVQPGFRLKNCYSQIGVNTECSIKYIFMTQSFMKKTFSHTDNKFDQKGFFIRTNTSFAY